MFEHRLAQQIPPLLTNSVTTQDFKMASPKNAKRFMYFLSVNSCSQSKVVFFKLKKAIIAVTRDLYRIVVVVAAIVQVACAQAQQYAGHR